MWLMSQSRKAPPACRSSSAPASGSGGGSSPMIWWRMPKRRLIAAATVASASGLADVAEGHGLEAQAGGEEGGGERARIEPRGQRQEDRARDAVSSSCGEAHQLLGGERRAPPRRRRAGGCRAVGDAAPRRRRGRRLVAEQPPHRAPAGARRGQVVDRAAMVERRRSTSWGGMAPVSASMASAGLEETRERLAERPTCTAEQRRRVGRQHRPAEAHVAPGAAAGGGVGGQ